MRPAELIFAVVCALWWAVALWVQVAPKQALLLRVRSWDPIYLVQSYRFFAPIPASSDVFVEYRFRVGDGAVTEWNALAVYEPRVWRSMVWHPGLLRASALNRLVERLVKVSERSGMQAAGQSLSFRQIVRHVASLPKPAGAHAVQVQVARGFQFNPEEARTPVFRSPWVETERP